MISIVMRMPAKGGPIQNESGLTPGGFPRPAQGGQNKDGKKDYQVSKQPYEREEPRQVSKQPAKKQPHQKAKQLLKEKAGKVAQKDKPSAKTNGPTKQIVESGGGKNQKKEAILAAARARIGASEQRRAEFKERIKQARIKRMNNEE